MEEKGQHFPVKSCGVEILNGIRGKTEVMKYLKIACKSYIYIFLDCLFVFMPTHTHTHTLWACT